jgi:hypothetical protein
MFGFGGGKSAYPNIYAASTTKKSPKRDNPSSAPKDENVSSPDDLEPAIEGPPSPERIRAYTEQMKRSSIFGNNSRTNTFSSATSSSRSRESTAPSTDNLSLSRRSSNRSNTSSMPSVRSERPESVAIFGSIFSRAGRKGRKENEARGLNRSSSSLAIAESSFEEGSAKEHFYGKGRSSQRKHLISGPYNFQHVTHTRQDHLPNLERASRMQLVSEFSAIRASQAPTKGELKDIQAEDLHFENFSSEALVVEQPAPAPRSPPSPRQRTVLRKSVTPPQSKRAMSYAKSHDNLRAPPPRPPRSPLESHPCPIAPPARTSSRTASVLFDTFDPLATTTIERPYTNSGFRRPAPFGLPSPAPLPLPWLEHQESNPNQPMSHAVTTPGDEAWPLTASLTGNSELADVKEEDEEVLSRMSRVSIASSELRMSQSVPALRRLSYEQANEIHESQMSTTLGRSSSGETVVPSKAPLSPSFQPVHDSWEDDIDYCYEHEVEADCDYQWDRCSVEEETVMNEVSEAQPQPILELHLQDEERVYHGRFRPSLLTPTPFELPELSPMSNVSIASSHPHTPSHFLRPGHARSPSGASSFKESHGFHLSPTLLIPTDFQSQMEQDEIYHEHFNALPGSASIFVQEPYQHSISPVDEGTSSTASYRSSNFSRGSARSSSSTRMSGSNLRGSQDSVMLLGRAENLSDEHRSVGSSSSLPDLILSTARQSDYDLPPTVLGLYIPDEHVDSAPAPEIGGPAPALASLQHRRNRSLALDGLRKGVNHFPSADPQVSANESAIANGNLSPVEESFPVSPSDGKGQGIVHERKFSAPTVSSVKQFKGRARAATSAAKLPGGKKRGSYMLFPQV